MATKLVEGTEIIGGGEVINLGGWAKAFRSGLGVAGLMSSIPV